MSNPWEKVYTFWAFSNAIGAEKPKKNAKVCRSAALRLTATAAVETSAEAAVLAGRHPSTGRLQPVGISGVAFKVMQDLQVCGRRMLSGA